LTQASYEQFNGLVPALKNVLGDWGLKVLGHYCRDHGALGFSYRISVQGCTN